MIPNFPRLVDTVSDWMPCNGYKAMVKSLNDRRRLVEVKRPCPWGDVGRPAMTKSGQCPRCRGSVPRVSYPPAEIPK